MPKAPTMPTMPDTPTMPDSGDTTDPAHSSNLNNNHTNASGEKPTTAFEAIVDKDFMPTLEEAPVEQQARSHLLLFALVGGAIVAAWFFGFEMLQIGEHSSWKTLGLLLGTLLAVAFAVVHWTGTLWVDWWELLIKYWWLSMPAGGAAGLALVMMQEQASGWNEVD